MLWFIHKNEALEWAFQAGVVRPHRQAKTGKITSLSASGSVGGIFRSRQPVLRRRGHRFALKN